MSIEELLPALQQNALCRTVFKKLDDASKEKLIGCIKTAVDSDNAEDRFFDCCGEAGLSEFGSLSLDDTGGGILSASDVQVLGDELVKILKAAKKK